MRGRLVAAAVFAIALATMVSAQPAARANPYTITITDLGTLGGSYSGALGVNNLGQVVGVSGTSSGASHAFLWEAGVMTDLGTLGGGESYARDINDAGQVVGWSETASGELHAFLWQAGVMTDLGTLGGRVHSFARAINSAGQIVGDSYDSPGCCPHRAFLWEAGTMTDLGTLGGDYASAVDINDLGQIVGDSAVASGSVHPFLWEAGTMTDLEAFAPMSVAATAALNDVGQIVLDCMYPESVRACLLEGGTVTDLGALEPGDDTQGHDINEAGQVVGGSGWAAFLWEAGTMTDLGTLGGIGGGAIAINDMGQVVGFSGTPTEASHATLWSLSAPSRECPRTQGYWKNHPESWPVDSLELGTTAYSQEDLLAILRTPVRGDASLILAHQLIAAKLNVASGSDPAPSSDEIAQADMLLSSFLSIPANVPPSSPTGQSIIAVAEQLDDYNNGLLTPDCSHADEDEGGTTQPTDGTLLSAPILGATASAAAALLALAWIRRGKR